MFTDKFDRYALPGDKITCHVDGFDVTARIEQDDSADRPDEMDDGFWPSLDPNSDGYIGPKSKSTLRRHMAKAREAMRAWEQGEWFYCGVAVTVEKNEVRLTDRYGASLWGIECNYPGSDNSYLTEVANELLGEALDEAKAKLASLCS